MLSYTVKQSGLGRGTRTLLRINQEKGFDCPGCAWPDPDHRSAAEFCENGARAVVDEATTLRVGPSFFANNSVQSLAGQADSWLNGRGRLTHPVIYRRGAGATHYEAIGWSEAFDLIGRELQALPDPNDAIFYTSGRTSNEAAFVYQLFVRSFGTNNLPDCSNMCHESSGAGLSAVIGIGKGTVQLSDFAQADAIVVIGQNPGTNHPRMLSTLREAKLRGCKVITINPLREAGLVKFAHPQKPKDLLRPVEISDLYLRVRVGGDVALLKGLAKCLLNAERRKPGSVLDQEFIEGFTQGFEAYKADIQRTSWAEITAGSGVSQQEIEQAAAMLLDSKATIACWAMGITQHKNGVANVQSIVNLLMLQGNLGRPGAGVCPVRGHSNVQGDRTVGIWEKTPPWFGALAEEFGITVPPQHGHSVVDAIRAMHEEPGKVFFAMGGNFLSATPDTAYTARALERCRLTVHVATKLNRAHLVTGEIGLILPCLARTERDEQAQGEQFVTVENSMGIVHPSRGRLEPASPELISEPMIVARLASATLGARSAVPWSSLVRNYDSIRELIARHIPGFDNYNDRVREPGGFMLPNAVRERVFNTASKKAEFTVHAVPDLELQADRLALTTVRSHDQFNTTIYEHDDRYRGIYGHRRVILLNTKDIRRLGLHDGDSVTVVSHFRGERRRAPSFVVVEHDIPQGNAAAYFPEANVLVPVESYADISLTPTSKFIEVSLHREAAAE